MIISRKTPLIALALVVSVAGISACKKESRQVEGGAPQANVREAVFEVEGMTCDSCNVTVKVAAERIAGVHSARADADQGRAWVSFDPAKTTEAQIASAISATGYKATPLSPDAGAPSGAVAPVAALAPTKLEPWEPANEAFRGCEGGCGMRVAKETPGIVPQPGAQPGQHVHCPVSGVVFEVKESSVRRELGGRTIYLCCESCAQYFDANRASILARRGFSE